MVAAPIDRVKALLAALPQEEQRELHRYLADILVTDDEAEAIHVATRSRSEGQDVRAHAHVASLEARPRGGGKAITYTYRQERVRCGKPACWCADGGLGHGPYTYKYWRDAEGKLRKEYVGTAGSEAGKARTRGAQPRSPAGDASSGKAGVAGVRPRARRGAGGRARGSTAASSSGPALPG